MNVLIYLQERDTPMARKYAGLFEEYSSRRDVLKGMAGFMLAVSLESCSQALSSSSSTPTPTSIPRRPGSLLYTYRGHTDRIPAVADITPLVTSTVVSEQGTEHLSVQSPDGYFAQISVA